MTGRGIAAVMVLAAGRGERMRPLSDVVPKPALPLPGGPVVASALRLAAVVGRPAVVNTWHLADRMEEAVRRVGPPPGGLELSREPRLMGTAGGLALARARGLLGTAGAVLVINGDSLYGLSLEPLLDRFRASDDLVSLALIAHPDPVRWSTVVLDAAGRVESIRRTTERRRDEPEPCHFPGVMVISREALDALPVEPGSTPDRLWEPARAAGRLGGVLVPGSWREVGTPAEYLEAVQLCLAGSSGVDPTAKVDSSAEVAASYVGEDVRIGAGSTVSDSVIACRSRLGRNVRVHRSVLLGPIEIPNGEVVEGVVRVADWR